MHQILTLLLDVYLGNSNHRSWFLKYGFVKLSSLSVLLQTSNNDHSNCLVACESPCWSYCRFLTRITLAFKLLVSLLVVENCQGLILALVVAFVFLGLYSSWASEATCLRLYLPLVLYLNVSLICQMFDISLNLRGLGC
jgi:hypothetical protein